MVQTIQGLFFLHLLQFPRRYSAQIMGGLRARGHEHLRLQFEPVIAALTVQDLRLTDLSAQLGMQKQNCMQLVKRIEAAGYLRRVADPGDRRSRLIGLSPAGEQLLQDAFEVLRDINARLESAVGAEEFEAFYQAVRSLCDGLSVAPRRAMGNPPGDVSSGLLFTETSRLALYSGTELNALVRELGYREIRTVHEQVLLHLREGRMRVQEIARENDVSRQAVSAIVNELRESGYVSLEVDPADARGRIIRLTPAGEQLLDRAAEAAGELLQRYEALLGRAQFLQAQQTLAGLYRSLAPPVAAGNAAIAELVRYLLAQIPGTLDGDSVASVALLRSLERAPDDPAAGKRLLQSRLESADLALLEDLLARLGQEQS